MKKIFLASGALILLLSAFLLWKTLNPPLSDEQQIARNLDGLVSAANNRSVAGIAGYLSPKFDFNGVKKQEFRGQLTGGILQYRVVDLGIAGVQIKVNGERATSDGRFVLNLKSEFQSPPETTRGDFELEWAKEDGEWRIVRAKGANVPR